MNSLLVIVVSVAAVACADDTKPGSTTASPIQIVLGLYSGVPDPTWQLSADQVGELDTALARLSRVNGTASAGGLGYHGFSIVNAGGTLVAFDGKVVSAFADPPNYLDDPDHTIERLLLETARPHVSAAEIDVVKAALDQP